MTALVVDGIEIPTGIDIDLGDLARPADLAAGLSAYLEGVTRLFSEHPQFLRSGYRYACYEALVLDQGRAWTPAPLPPKLRRGPMRLCYANTLNLIADRPTLQYVEGFAIPWVDGHAGEPSLHCWAGNANGRVFDPTWPEPEHSAYVGIAFPLADVKRFINLDEDTFGILGTEVLIGSPLLRTGVLFRPEAPRDRSRR